MSERWRLLDVQVVELSDGLLLSRGTLTLRLGGSGIGAVVAALREKACQGPFLEEELLERFEPAKRPAVARLVEQLRARRLIVPAETATTPEPAEGVFFWNFELEAETVARRRGAAPVHVLGVNSVSRALIGALCDPDRAAPAPPRMLDYPPLRSTRLFEGGRLRPGAWPDRLPPPEEAGNLAEALPPEGLVVATSDFGGAHLLRPINEACVGRGVHFLPVVLDRHVGRLGPLVVAGETPCYECLRARENATMDAPAVERAPEYEAGSAQSSRGGHPSMARLLGEVAAFEVDTAVTLGSRQEIGHVLEVAPMRGAMTRRPVLRVPHCSVCAEVHGRPLPALGRTAGVGRGGDR